MTRKRETPSRTQQQPPAAEHLAPVTHAEQEPARPIELLDIEADPNNPRPFHDDAKYQELRSSVRQHGVLQNIVVRPHPKPGGVPFMLVAGERRWRAAKAEGLREINAIVRDLGDQAAFELALIENLNREDMSPIDEALGYKYLIEEFRLDVHDISAKVGKPEQYIRRRLVLANLDPSALDHVRSEVLTFGGAEELARAPRLVQVKFLGQVHQELQFHRQRQASGGGSTLGGPTYRAAEVRRFVRGELRVLPLARAPFDLTDEALPPLPCVRCPKNTAQQRDLFAEPDGPGECTDIACYDKKADLFWSRAKERAKDEGLQIIEGEEAKKYIQHGSLPWDSELVDLGKDCEEDPVYQAAMEKYEEIDDSSQDDDQEVEGKTQEAAPPKPAPTEPTPSTYKDLLLPYLKEHPEHIALIRIQNGHGGDQILHCVRRSELPDLMHNVGREDIAKQLKERAARTARYGNSPSSDHKADMAKRALESRAEARALQACSENIGVFLHGCFGKPVTSNEVQKIELKAILRELVCAVWTKKNSAAAKRRNLGTDPPDSPYSDRVKDDPRLASMEAPALLSFLIELIIEDKCYHFVGKRMHRVLSALSSMNYDDMRRQFIREEKDKTKARDKKTKEKEKKGKPALAATPPAAKKGKKK